MPATSINLGRVRGDDGISPEITVKTNSPKEYVLHIKDKTHEFDTPNLRGATFKSAIVEVLGHEPLIIPFTDLGLDPSKDYQFYASAGIDYPSLRNINAIRITNAEHPHAVQISVYYDTVPYTTPQQGSPFDGEFIKLGTPGLIAGDFNIGEQFDGEPFPVNLLCFELDAEETEENE
jgi:hypothetical protein